MRWCIIADDNTGASDAAGMLTAQGVRTVLLLTADFPAATHDFDAVVIGTQNRSLPPTDAYAATRDAVVKARAHGFDRFQIKYCSTFDSTPQGNIGPTLDAALDVLPTPATIVCPALPINGRTVYQGHLFVGRQLLSDSPLRHHPLNPMTDANLVRWLQHQTKRTVELVPLDVVRRGPAAVRQRMQELIAAGNAYLVTDAITDADLAILAEATADWPLLSGGSGITAALPSVHYPNRQPLDFSSKLAALKPATLVVSGSQSPMTHRQTAQALANGFTGFRLDIPAILQGSFAVDAVVREARQLLAGNRPVLFHSPATVQETQKLGASLGLDEVAIGERIAVALGEIACDLLPLVGRLVVSGGETSGAVCRALGVTALEVGLPLAPGVPYCFPLPAGTPLLVLKSGNFGEERLYNQVRDL